ncbi:hypothetical protein EDB80DRAFT_437925 [Ilyonectria destructans]|nr:hypothetical protein EDB80DRAFT_437925 [Ilyonectria destructans]
MRSRSNQIKGIVHPMFCLFFSNFGSFIYAAIIPSQVEFILPFLVRMIRTNICTYLIYKLIRSISQLLLGRSITHKIQPRTKKINSNGTLICILALVLLNVPAFGITSTTVSVHSNKPRFTVMLHIMLHEDPLVSTSPITRDLRVEL